jgi:hypothetical protein
VAKRTSSVQLTVSTVNGSSSFGGTSSITVSK